MLFQSPLRGSKIFLGNNNQFLFIYNIYTKSFIHPMRGRYVASDGGCHCDKIMQTQPRLA